jgi:hypothetical protein
MRMERSAEEDSRTVEEGKNRRERTVERWGVPTCRCGVVVVVVVVMVGPRPVDETTMEPSACPVAYRMPSGETSNAVIFLLCVFNEVSQHWARNGGIESMRLGPATRVTNDPGGPTRGWDASAATSGKKTAAFSSEVA